MAFPSLAENGRGDHTWHSSVVTHGVHVDTTPEKGSDNMESQSIASVGKGRSLATTSDPEPRTTSFWKTAKEWPYAVMWSAMFSSTLILYVHSCLFCTIAFTPWERDS